MLLLKVTGLSTPKIFYESNWLELLIKSNSMVGNTPIVKNILFFQNDMKMS